MTHEVTSPPNILATPTTIHRGVTFGFYRRRGEWETAECRQEIDRMTELNIDWVCVVPTIMMESPVDPRQFCDFENTPSDLELVDTIEYIHERGMKVHLRPMIECWDGHGRLDIRFPKDRPNGARIPGLSSTRWETWWRVMRARTKHYAKIAQRYHCEMYSLESEVDQFTTMHKRWREVLDVARSVYDGPVTSSHTHQVAFIKQLQEEEDHWFRDLDCLGTSFYHKSADKLNATVEERMAYLEPQREAYRKMAKLLGKPIMFGEIGCTSSTGGGMHPAGWQGDGGYDPEEQATYLEAVLRLFWDEPWWAGLYWWKWDENNHRTQFVDDPAGNKGFTIYGKKAADVMTQWFSRKDRR